MLILLPPSEGKASLQRGKPLELSDLSTPELTEARLRMLQALIEVSASSKAVQTLGLSPGLADLAAANTHLFSAPTARADHIYTGVLYDTLGQPALSPAAKRRAHSRIAIMSSVFGVLRPADRIPAYRLSGSVSLPTLGTVAAYWRTALERPLVTMAGSGLVVDLRSTTYAAFWRPPSSLAPQFATVRVLHETDGKRSVVSHFNKATKGRIVRALLEDGATPRSPQSLALALQRLGWLVEVSPATSAGIRLDVIVHTL